MNKQEGKQVIQSANLKQAFTVRIPFLKNWKPAFNQYGAVHCHWLSSYCRHTEKDYCKSPCNSLNVILFCNIC